MGQTAATARMYLEIGNPTINDDETLGYEVGNFWYDSVTGEHFQANSVNVGAAVWNQFSIHGQPATFTDLIADNLLLNNGGALKSGASAADTLLIQAFDTDTGPAYTTFITLTSNNTPTCDLSDTVTKAGNYIYRAGGTDVDVADGGSGASTLTGILTGNGISAFTASTVTQHGVLLGGSSNAVSSLGVASTGTVLTGATGADPAFSATPAVTSIAIGAGGLTITSGAGAPGASEPKGSLYLRTDGGGVNDRMYVATDSIGGWTAVVTVA